MSADPWNITIIETPEQIAAYEENVTAGMEWLNCRNICYTYQQHLSECKQDRSCECGNPLDSRKPSARYCSDACKQKAYRARH